MMDIIVRKLSKTDLNNGFLEVFDVERHADFQHAAEIFDRISSSPNHIIFIAIVNDEIVGSVTLLIEPKFIRNGGIVGHIEDVEVKKEYHKKGIGKYLMKKVVEYAENIGCYKTILDCSDEVIPFYKSIGFSHQDFLGSNVMRYNHENK